MYGVRVRAGVDERQRRHLAGPLLGQGRGHVPPGGMPDDRHPARAEPVQDGADPAGLGRDVVPAGGAADLPWPARSTRMTR